MLRIGGTIVGIAASITMLFAVPPLGIIMAIGTVFSAITKFFKSQKEKQREAAEKISQSLNNQLEEYQRKTFIGVDFKPWQAVGIAKDLANFTMFLGSVLAVVGAGLDAHSMQKEAERQDKMSMARLTSKLQAHVNRKKVRSLLLTLG